MAIYQLSRESLGNVNLKDGVARHKFIATPFKIFFGDDGEFHVKLLDFWQGMEQEDPELFAHEQEAFKRLSVGGCPHLKAEELAIVDAGLMVVEGLQVPETIAFTERSDEYGMGDRMRTQLLAETMLHGTWKLHLPEPVTQS